MPNSSEIFQKLEDDLMEISKNDSIGIDQPTLQRFDAGLFAALAQYNLPASNAARGGAVRALRACIDLIRSRKEWREAGLVAPLVELQMALMDNEHGHIAPILEKPKSNGRPSAAVDAMLRGYAAGIMGGLMTHGGFAKKRAATWVAERLSDAGWSGITGGTVAGWRKEALEAPKSVTSERYRIPIDQANWSDAEREATRLIANLISIRPKQKK